MNTGKHQAMANCRQLKVVASAVCAMLLALIRSSFSALKETENAAQALGLKLEYLDMQKADDAESVFNAVGKTQTQALLVLQNPIAGIHRARIVQLAAKRRFPVMYHRRDFVEVGGLMFYGADAIDLHKRAATYVDKILKGASPQSFQWSNRPSSSS
jgi:putative ABC transport system substrate-binding protein